MGKSVGFIGNFKGKLGNTVGFKVSQSNSGTNQGVRVYQPNIKNPKSAAQAEQRAKYAPIFATYRALKMIIDRGNESKTYGNASRVAWLRKAFQADYIPWTHKGFPTDYPVLCQLTQGTLKGIPFIINGDALVFDLTVAAPVGAITTIGMVSTILLENFLYLKEGDKDTFILNMPSNGVLDFQIVSYILDEGDTTRVRDWTVQDNLLKLFSYDQIDAAAVIVSRQGTKGEHLRSTSFLTPMDNLTHYPPYDNATKQEAIASYMATDSANADWAEESIQ